MTTAGQRLQQKTALITGGRRGIGRAIVEMFAREGAKVMTCGRGERPDDLPAAIVWRQADIADTNAVQDLRERVTSEFGQLSVLVNNAGVQIEKTVLDTTDDDWDKLMGTNAKGVFLACRELLPLMPTGASIINIGSISGDVADPGMALYNASKAFVHGLTRAIATDHGPGVRCNAICPGWIMTGMADAAFAQSRDPAAAQRDALAHHAVGRFGQVEDIAKLAVYLASDESSFVSGQCYRIDGGLTAVSPIKPQLV